MILYCHHQDEVTQAPVLRVEENEWASGVAPVWFSLLSPGPWIFDQNESPTLQTALVFDEWQSLAQSVWAYPLPQTFTSDETITAPATPLAIDEDFSPITPSRIVYGAPRAFTVDDEIVPTPPIQDEDLWCNPVAPAWNYPARVFSDDEVFQVMPPHRDEDLWRNPVAPVAAFNYIALPYLPDPEEIPAGSLFVALPADVVGVGILTPQVGGVGVVTVSSGVGIISGEVAGSGRVN